MNQRWLPVALALVFPFVPGLFFLRAFSRGPGALKGVSGLALLCLLFPLAIGYLNALSVKNCSPQEGLGWYMLLSAPAMVWVASLAWFCAAANPRFASTWKGGFSGGVAPFGIGSCSRRAK